MAVAEFYGKERTERELVRIIGKPGEAYRTVAKTLSERVKIEEVPGSEGYLVTPIELEIEGYGSAQASAPQRRG